MTTWLFVGLLADLLLGNAGVYFPGLALTVLYFAVVSGWRSTIHLAAGFALLGDAVLMRASHPGVIAVLPVVYLATLWRQQGDCRAPTAHALAGALAGLLFAGVSIALKHLFCTTFWVEALEDLLRVALAGVLCGLVFPLLRALLDGGARAMQLPCFADARDRARELSHGT